MEVRLDFINKELETRTDYETDSYSNLITELTELNTRLDIIGAGNREEQIEKF